MELALTFSLLPLVVAVFRRGIRQDPLRLSAWSWRVVYVLLAYYAFHFYLFIARASVELTSDITWHMFSAGWILLFALGVCLLSGCASEVRRQPPRHRWRNACQRAPPSNRLGPLGVYLRRPDRSGEAVLRDPDGRYNTPPPAFHQRCPR